MHPTLENGVAAQLLLVTVDLNTGHNLLNIVEVPKRVLLRSFLIVWKYISARSLGWNAEKAEEGGL